MVRTVMQLVNVDLGIGTRQVLSAQITVREQSYPDAESRVALLDRLHIAAAGITNVSHVAIADPSPLASYMPITVRTGDGTPPTRVERRAVMGDYLGLLGIPLLRGRDFNGADRGSPSVVLVSESAAQRIWPDRDAVGQTMRLVENDLARGDTVTVTRTVVGVVADVRQSPTDSILAEIYVPMLQSPPRFATVVTRTARALPAWEPEIRRAARAVDAEMAVSAPRDVDAEREAQLARPRFLIVVFALFGGFATLLGVLGLYTVIAYAVRQREHEIAVRMAIGAGTGSITSLFMREGMVVTAVGLVVGVAGASAVGRLLESQLFGIQATDPVTLAGAAILLAVSAFVAIWWPARRAAATDPVIALWGER
jgi:predicted permease